MPLHTQAKGHDHVVVRTLDSHSKTVVLTCFVEGCILFLGDWANANFDKS